MPEAQGSRHARESKSGIPENFLLVESGILEILMEEVGILGFGILNPRRIIQNLGLSCIPLHLGNKVMCSPHMPGRRNWNSLMTLFIWAALLVMKIALGEDINKVMP